MKDLTLLTAALPDILTVKDVQDYLHIGRSKAYQLISSGEIQHIRLGNAIRIPKPYFLAFLEQNSEGAPPFSKPAN